MERLDKKTFIQQMSSERFLVGFLDYTRFTQIKKGFIANSVLSLYNDVYDIDDCFCDMGYLVLIKKTDIIGKGFEKVRIVDNPKNIYEKNDNDFEEVKAVITRLEIEPSFYYIREMVK